VKTGSMGCRLMALVLFFMVANWLTPVHGLCANENMWEAGRQGGWAVTPMSDDTFGDEDFGRPLQITSHTGFEYAFLENLSVTVRVQHMSNAGIYRGNPAS